MTEDGAGWPSQDMVHWDRCRIWLAAAMEVAGDTHGLDEVFGLIAAGEARFWCGAACATVLDFYETPKVRAVNFWLVGGDLAELTSVLLPPIADWARDQGFRALMGSGRPAWGRALRRHGFAPMHTTFAKEL